MARELAPLPYAFNALEPHIDAQTMEIHHDKHHATYVTNVNNAVAGTNLENVSSMDLVKDLSQVPEEKRTAVRNNAGGDVNHTFFWELLTPGGATAPSGALADAINAMFGGLDGLKEKVNAAGAARFGSGWAWLVVNGSGELEVLSTANQDSPLSDGQTPVVGVDVWEHAYYLKYQNKRPAYLEAFWNVVNWDVAGKIFTAAS
ncbi:MAG: superoxide dismutase [Chloroflexia bacterium]|jgi:Fe-Mn family superoxide dismutase|nr:superoxide dismutase [Chloroflexia bacterium]